MEGHGQEFENSPVLSGQEKGSDFELNAVYANFKLHLIKCIAFRIVEQLYGYDLRSVVIYIDSLIK